MMQDLLTVFSGGIVGFVLGLIGGGGSILAVPLLVYLVGVASPHVAIGTSAVAVALSALANVVAHARQGHVKWRCAMVFAAAGMVGAALGSSFGKQFDGQKLLVLFGALMIVIAVMMLLSRSDAGDSDVHLTAKSAPHLMPFLLAYGTAVGALSGFFGIGGGFLVVPALMAATGMPLIYAVGSSLVSVAAFGLVTSANYALSGFIDWALVAFFITGAAAGGLLGNFVSQRAAGEGHILSRIFAIIVSIVGVYIIARGTGLMAD